MTTPPFAIGKPFVRQPWGDTRVTPEDRRRTVAQRAAEVAERRAVFDVNNNNGGDMVVHWHFCTRIPELDPSRFIAEIVRCAINFSSIFYR